MAQGSRGDHGGYDDHLSGSSENLRGAGAGGASPAWGTTGNQRPAWDRSRDLPRRVRGGSWPKRRGKNHSAQDRRHPPLSHHGRGRSGRDRRPARAGQGAAPFGRGPCRGTHPLLEAHGAGEPSPLRWAPQHARQGSPPAGGRAPWARRPRSRAGCASAWPSPGPSSIVRRSSSSTSPLPGSIPRGWRTYGVSCGSYPRSASLCSTPPTTCWRRSVSPPAFSSLTKAVSSLRAQRQRSWPGPRQSGQQCSPWDRSPKSMTACLRDRGRSSPLTGGRSQATDCVARGKRRSVRPCGLGPPRAGGAADEGRRHHRGVLRCGPRLPSSSIACGA